MMRPKQPGQKKRKNRFVRHNWFRFPRLGLKWRYPKGHHSKMRQGRKSRPPMPNAGYGSPAAVRGLVRGMKPVLVSNFADLQKVNAKANEVAVLAAALGKKKTIMIAAEAEKRGIKILNHRKVSAAEHFAHEMKKRKEQAKASAAPKPKEEKSDKQKENEHHEKPKTPEPTMTEKKAHDAGHHAHTGKK